MLKSVKWLLSTFMLFDKSVYESIFSMSDIHIIFIFDNPYGMIPKKIVLIIPFRCIFSISDLRIISFVYSALEGNKRNKA